MASLFFLRFGMYYDLPLLKKSCRCLCAAFFVRPSLITIVVIEWSSRG
jgi:hypothetical protein